MAARRSIAAIEDMVARLADLPRDELVTSWIKTHGHPSPKGVGRGLLERDQAYQMQVNVFRGLKPATLKALLSVARGDEVEQPVTAIKLTPGSRLVREWHGIAHQVDVTDNGYMWNGKPYSSLSAVARAITGTRWSGPRFFGL